MRSIFHREKQRNVTTVNKLIATDCLRVFPYKRLHFIFYTLINLTREMAVKIKVCPYFIKVHWFFVFDQILVLWLDLENKDEDV